MSQLGYTDTPFLPGKPWRVHDANRPQPAIVTPAPVENPFAPPSDAVVLFDGTALEQWRTLDGEAAGWQLIGDGAMEVVPKSGNIRTTHEFGDCQLHLEFRSPDVVKGDGQGRGNSGIFLVGLYEIQVLDCYDNPTYPDGTVCAIYGQTPPLVNPSRKPGEWQRCDIIFTVPRFMASGEITTYAYATVFLNGVLVQHHTKLIGQTMHKEVGIYKEHPEKGPLVLQDHGDLVRYRNIWYRPLSDTNDAP